MDRLDALYAKMVDEAPRFFPESNRPYILELARLYATEVARHNLERAAEAAKVLVSNGESTVDVKSWTLEDGIRFSPDYRRITSLEIELI